MKNKAILVFIYLILIASLVYSKNIDYNYNNQVLEKYYSEPLFFRDSRYLIQNVTLPDEFEITISQTDSGSVYGIAFDFHNKSETIKCSSGILNVSYISVDAKHSYGIIHKYDGRISSSDFSGSAIRCDFINQSVETTPFCFAYRTIGSVLDQISYKGTEFSVNSKNYISSFAFNSYGSTISNTDFSYAKFNATAKNTSIAQRTNRAYGIFAEATSKENSAKGVSISNCSFSNATFNVKGYLSGADVELRVFGVAVESIYSNVKSILTDCNFDNTSFSIIGKNANSSNFSTVYGILVWNNAIFSNNSFKDSFIGTYANKGTQAKNYIIWNENGIISNVDFRGTTVSYEYDEDSDSWQNKSLFAASDIYGNSDSDHVKNVILGDGTLFNPSLNKSDDILSIGTSAISVSCSGDISLIGNGKIEFLNKSSNDDGAKLFVSQLKVDGGDIAVYLSDGYDPSISELILIEYGLIDFVSAPTFTVRDYEGVDVTSDWCLKYSDGKISMFQIPEPATYAAIFGVLTLAFAAYRRRK